MLSTTLPNHSSFSCQTHTVRSDPAKTQTSHSQERLMAAAATAAAMRNKMNHAAHEEAQKEGERRAAQVRHAKPKL